MLQSQLKTNKYTVTCPTTNSKLYTLGDNIKTVVHDSYGTCVGCNKDYHVDAIKFHDGFYHVKWIVIYEGVLCKTCWSEI